MAPTATPRTERSGPPLYALIYDVLREHIVDGSFPPGLVLGEASVARAFQASRVPAAAALRRLQRDGLVRDFDGRGYVTGGNAAPVRIDLAEAGLRLPAGLAGDLKLRNRRERIYPEVEHAVAACLSYGRFLLNESALAEHHGVSRTVAHEVLTRLERTGLVTQDVNQRWYAGPLTAELLREHYEMRWLLEPIALGQALPGLDRDGNRRQAAAGREGARQPPQAGRARAARARPARRHRAPLREPPAPRDHPAEPAADHRHPFDLRARAGPARDRDHGRRAHRHPRAIRDGRRAAAMAALEAHLRRSLEPNIELLRKLGPLGDGRRPPYLVPVA